MSYVLDYIKRSNPKLFTHFTVHLGSYTTNWCNLMNVYIMILCFRSTKEASWMWYRERVWRCTLTRILCLTLLQSVAIFSEALELVKCQRHHRDGSTNTIISVCNKCWKILIIKKDTRNCLNTRKWIRKKQTTYTSVPILRSKRTKCVNQTNNNILINLYHPKQAADGRELGFTDDDLEMVN